MKRIPSSSVLIAAMVISLFSFSCNKDDSPPVEEPGNSRCRINSVFDVAGDASYQMTYNDAGKVVKIAVLGFEQTFQYSSNTITIDNRISGAFASKSIVTLNSSGYVINVRVERNESGTSWQNDQYEYQDGTKLIRQTSTSSSTVPFINNFVWENGNIVSAKSATGNETFYTYYPDMPKQAGDFFSYLELISTGGAKLFDTKNSLKSIEVGGDITKFSYEKDQDNKIITMAIQTGTSPAANVIYGYECE